VYTILLILVFALSSVAHGEQKLDTISLKFEREVVQDDSTEIVKGIAYYQAPLKVFIEVQEPVKQIMIVGPPTARQKAQWLTDGIDNDSDGATDEPDEGAYRSAMLIYYPVEKKAFRIKAKGLIPMPFIQNILSIMKDDYGLTETGYTLTKHERKGDTLYTYWTPPRKLKKHLGKFILGTANGVLVYAEAKNPKGKTAAKSFYKKHIELAGKQFPLEVRSEIFGGPKRTEEFVTYSEVEFNIALPDRVTSFKLPDSVPVDEVEW